MTKRHVSEDIFGIQICGSKVDHVVKACEVINEELDVDFVDLNMGCPIDLVFNSVGYIIFFTKKKSLLITFAKKRVLDRRFPSLEVAWSKCFVVCAECSMSPSPSSSERA